ncbi:MAG: tetratricopeptide repeat protein [Alphaproteobacteria bacterium]|nr:tetratricopeptide repeat protein [Alphaproteobacteria bacterium]
MSEFQDRWGCPVTAGSQDAVIAYEETILSYLAMQTDIADRLDSLFALDPSMPMAMILKASLVKMLATAEMQETAVSLALQAHECVAKIPVTDRESAHLSALNAWLEGEMETACMRWEAILIDHPRDVLAIKLSQLNRFYLGDAGQMRDALARVWYAWDNSVPAYGFIAGSYAFALEESGAYERAERLGRDAVALEPADIWSAHAVAHVLEMQGRAAEGLEWLNNLRKHWGAVHNFVHHAHWHRALFALGLGDTANALAIFDGDVWTDKVADYLDLSNGASLLWRIQEAGIDTQDRESSVAKLAKALSRDHGLVFADCHIALSLAQAGCMEDVSDFLDELDRFSGKPGTQSRVMADIGRMLCMASVADAAGDAQGVVDLMLPCRHDIRRIGGSHAQRDLFYRMLVRNILQLQQVPLARALLSERLEVQAGDYWAQEKQAALSSEFC